MTNTTLDLDDIRAVLRETVSQYNVGALDDCPNAWRITRRGQSDGKYLWCLRSGEPGYEVVAKLNVDPKCFKWERERLNSEMDDAFIARTRAPLSFVLDYAERWPGASPARVALVRSISHLLENT